MNTVSWKGNRGRTSYNQRKVLPKKTMNSKLGIDSTLGNPSWITKMAADGDHSDKRVDLEILLLPQVSAVENIARNSHHRKFYSRRNAVPHDHRAEERTPVAAVETVVVVVRNYPRGSSSIVYSCYRRYSLLLLMRNLLFHRRKLTSQPKRYDKADRASSW